MMPQWVNIVWILNIGFSVSNLFTIFFGALWFTVSPILIVCTAFSWMATLTVNPVWDEFVDKYFKRK